MRKHFTDRIRDDVLVIFFFASSLLIGICLGSLGHATMLIMGGSLLLSPLIAIKKRYPPYYWLLACGPVGLIVIALLPPLKSAKDPEEYERFEARGNFIGAVLSAIAILVGMFLVVAILSRVVAQFRPTGVAG